MLSYYRISCYVRNMMAHSKEKTFSVHRQVTMEGGF